MDNERNLYSKIRQFNKIWKSVCQTPILECYRYRWLFEKVKIFRIFTSPLFKNTPLCLYKVWELLSKAVLLAFLKALNFLQNHSAPWKPHDRLQVNMLFRGSAATTRAHQEKAIRRRKSGRNRLQADRHRGRTGQAGREDFTSLVCQVVRRKSAESAALCAGQGRQPCPVDVMPCVISYWVLSGA